MFPNLLETTIGRRIVFFFLYVTEGIPLGFTATAITFQMREEGLGPKAVSAFVGMLYLPWAFKWIVAPIVDIVYSERLGRRRAWIVAMQTLMILCLFASIGVNFSTHLKFFSAIIFAVNVFGATQDVAIDALACNVLPENERGVANGLMFSGAYVGQALGGSGVLFLTAYLGFKISSMLAVASILMITLCIAIPLREKTEKPTIDELREGPALQAILFRIRKYLTDAARALLGNRSAAVALLFACLPCGAMALSLALATTLGVELGMTDQHFATLTLVTTIIAAIFCVLGGFLSDHFGRKKMLAMTAIGMAIPTLALAFWMQREGYIMPISPTLKNRPEVAPVLVTAFIMASLGYSIFQGLMFGMRSALFMDVCQPEVAATQFTAYMSLMNFVIFYTAAWQGFAIEQWGYPMTLTIDAVAGILCVFLLPWIVPVAKSSTDVNKIDHTDRTLSE